MITAPGRRSFMIAWAWAWAWAWACACVRRGRAGQGGAGSEERGAGQAAGEPGGRHDRRVNAAGPPDLPDRDRAGQQGAEPARADAPLPERYPPLPEPLLVRGGELADVVDDHTHLDSLADHEVDALLAAAARVGVARAVQVGTDVASSRWTVRAVERWPQLLGAVAIHPNEAPRLAQRGGLDAALTEIAELARHPRVRAVGESGMDAYRTDLTDPAALRAQRESFAAHVAIAKETGTALQIHDRDAHDHVLDVLAAEGAPERTVFHCFSGDAALARRCAEEGWYLSFAGTVTFKNAQVLRDALAVVPPGQLQVETDAPFLTPAPHRGRPNASHLVPHTVRAMADVLGLDTQELALILTRTAEHLYGPWYDLGDPGPT